MKYCPHCGKEVNEDAVVCVSCGRSLAREEIAKDSTTPQKPVRQLNTKRSLLKYILLSIVTFFIYSIVVLSSISVDINIIASKHDGKKTMHYCLVFFIFSWLTLGIVPLIWYHKLSERVGYELVRRNLPYRFGAGDFWLWSFLGSLIIVGPFIYMYKLLKSMNLLSEDYNQHG